MPARFLTLAIVFVCALGALPARAGTIPLGPGTLAGVSDLGRAPASVTVRIAAVLNYHHDAELERLIEQQADPSSALYGHFLSTAQFRQYFAPSQAEYNRVVAALRRGGFKITHQFPNRTVIDATAAAPVASRYFHTDIHRVMTPTGLSYTNATPAFVPAEIGDQVLTVVGLDASWRLHPEYKFPKPGTARGIGSTLRSDGGAALYGPNGGYGPQVFINSYKMPSLNGYNGSGRGTAVATDADFLDSDLAGYLSYFGVNRTGSTTRVLVDGGPPPGLSYDSVETELDVETIASISPGAALYVYEVAYDEPTNSNFIDIFNQVVTDNLVDAVNSSYIYCETQLNADFPGLPKAEDHVEKQGAAQGITFHAGSGDSGSQSPGCYSGGNQVGTPSSATHDIAVGGTTLNVDSQGNETSEVAWGGSGGGVSQIFKRPGYQKKVKNTISTGRNVPDVAFDADPGTGEALFYDGYWGSVGGTSLAGPIFNALLVQMNQVRNQRAGYFNVALYKTWRKHGYGNGSKAYMRDITQGSNGGFSAGTGYDNVTGLGAILGNNFLSIWP
jgi:kumamolisin